MKVGVSMQSYNIRKITDFNDTELIHAFFNGINQSIGIEDDKDTFEDFIQILKSSDEYCKFELYYIEIGNKIASGAMICNISLEGSSSSVIIYLFTNKDYRGLGLGTQIVKGIVDSSHKSFFLAEVLDNSKTTSLQEFIESSYSGIDTNSRENFWYRNEFRKLPLNYYNPSPSTEDYSIGCINYNSLWLNNSHSIEITNEILLEILCVYFQYGYGANQTIGTDIQAYKRNSSQMIN